MKKTLKPNEISDKHNNEEVQKSNIEKIYKNMKPLETVVIDSNMKLTKEEAILIEVIRWCGIGVDRVLLELNKFNETMKLKYSDIRSLDEIKDNIENAINCVKDKNVKLKMRYNGYYDTEASDLESEKI